MTEENATPVDEFVARYVREERLYADCTHRLRELLERVLEGAGLASRLHSVTCRPKEPEKLRKKLLKGEGRYASLTDVTDLVGIRVITYFGEDVDEVANIIEKEFTIDPANSTDKRKALDPDRFGYLSLHYVCSLTPERAALAEYEAFKDMKCEIQVRSILQHAWAEIEHDLGYKTKEAIPAQSQRRFARLAGLLELADDEFRGIRKDLDDYAARVPAEIKQDPAEVRIDKISLLSFVAEDELVRSVDSELAEMLNVDLETEPKGSYLGPIVGLLRATGFNSISELREALEIHKTEVVEHYGRTAIRLETDRDHRVYISGGISLFRLLVLVLAKQKDLELFRVAWSKADWELDSIDVFAQKQIDALTNSQEAADET